MIKRCGMLLAVLTVLGLCGCGRESLPHADDFRYLDYPVHVEVPLGEEHHLRGVSSVVQNELDDLKKVFDYKNPNSEYARMNEVAGTVWLPISFNMERLMKKAVEFHSLTRGTFDVTLTALSQIWGFEGGVIPEEVPKEVVAAGLMVTGVDRILLANNAVRYDVDVLYVNLSAILEGYLADLALIRVRNFNYRNVMINLGGCYRVLGEAAPDQPWTVPVTNPFDRTQELGQVVFTNRIALAVSSIKDKVNIINGEEVGHIIDPRSGYPANTVAQTVVVGPTATACDALATSLTVAGVEDSPSVLYNFDRYEAMLVLNEQPLTIWMSKGMAGYIDLKGIPPERIHILPEYVPTDEELAGAPVKIRKKLPDWDMRVFTRKGDKEKAAKARDAAAKDEGGDQ